MDREKKRYSGFLKVPKKIKFILMGSLCWYIFLVGSFLVTNTYLPKKTCHHICRFSDWCHLIEESFFGRLVERIVSVNRIFCLCLVSFFTSSSGSRGSPKAPKGCLLWHCTEQSCTLWHSPFTRIHIYVFCLYNQNFKVYKNKRITKVKKNWALTFFFRICGKKKL